MKKEYVTPMMRGELFSATDYCVSSCGDSGTVYKFKCTADAGTLYYYPDSDGTIDGIYNGTGSAVKLGDYHPCNAAHEAESTNPFYDGFVDFNKNKKCEVNERVIVWRGPRNDNGHATAELNMSQWETARS